MCEAERYCSLPDDACPSRRRFSEHAPADLAERCVAPEGGSTEGSTTGMSSDDGSTATGSTTTDCEGCACDVQLVVAGDRSCVILDGDLLCWGINGQGELGDPLDDSDVFVPRQVPLMGATVLDVALGDHACARLADGVSCWGPNTAGQVEQGSDGTMEVLGPTRATDPRLISVMAVAVAVGEQWSCALPGADDNVLCWGQVDRVGSDATTAELSLAGLGGSAQDLVMTRFAVCVRADDGQIWCAGDNIAGALGQPATVEHSDAFVVVPGVTGAVGLESANDMVCAWSDDTVTCWGRNNLGEGGIEPPMTMGNVQPPTEITVPVTRLAQSTSTTCAIDDGVVRCWGGRLPGITGDETHEPLPQTWLEEPVSAPIAQIGLGQAHACVGTADRQVWCWGDNLGGQVGVPGVESVATPTLVSIDCGS